MRNGFIIGLIVGLIFIGCVPRGSTPRDQSSAITVTDNVINAEQPQRLNAEPENIIQQFDIPEHALNASDTEITLFDLYVGDKYQGLILARFTPEYFEIESPEDVAEQIQNLKNSSAVTELCTGTIPLSREILGVGSITAHINTFRIVLRLEPTLLSGTNLQLGNLLPDPIDDLSFRQDFSSSFTGRTSEEITGAFSHRTIASTGRIWANASGTFVDGEEYEADEYSLTGIFGTNRLSFGLLQTDGQRFAGSADYLGFSARTAEEVLVHSDTLRGSQLQIYVPSRSTVEFYRGGRLLDVQVLDFGLQEVNTSRFPQGSYEVEIVIREDSGGVSRETRFFTKSGRLALRDQPLFQLHAGMLRDQFELLSVPVYQADLAWRAFSFLQLQGGATGTDDLHIGYLSLLGIYENTFLGAGYHLSNDGYSGVTGEFNGTFWGMNVTLNYGGTLKAGDDSSGRETNPLYFTERSDPLYLKQRDISDVLIREIDSISRKQHSFTATLSKHFPPFELRFSANHTQRDDDSSRYTIGPSIVWWLVQAARSALRLELAYFETETGQDISLMASYRLTLSPWSYDSQLATNSRDNDAEIRATGTATYDTRSRSGRGTRAIVRADALQTDDKKAIGSVQLLHTAEMLTGTLNLRQTQSENSFTSVGATFDTSLLAGSDALHLSYRTDGEAVLLATLERSDSTEPVELLVNGSPFDKLSPGSTTAIGLPAFKTLRLRIRHTGLTELVRADEDEFIVTTFPGNIIKKTWKIERVHVAIGTVVSERGEPITNARLEGTKDYTVTDELGGFYAELTGKESLVIDRNGGERCAIELPQLKDVQYYHEYGTLVCKRQQ